MGKIIVITGGSSGIGLCAARTLVSRNCTVYELSRHDPAETGVTHIGTDVTDEASVRAAVEKIIQEAGRIDVLLNNAGYGISGAVEFTSVEEAQRQLDVNFWGMVRATKAVLPHMRRQGSGRIVNTSSIAGPVPIPFQAYYSVSKAAINSFTMSCANEVRPYGITVCAVMPGDTHTGFTAARSKTMAGDEEYGGRISRSVTKMEKDEQGGGTAEAAGAYLARIALAEDHKVYHAIGAFAKLVTVLIRILPATFANRLIGMLYAE